MAISLLWTNVADWALPFRYSGENILPIASRLHATLDPAILLNSRNQVYDHTKFGLRWFGLGWLVLDLWPIWMT